MNFIDRIKSVKNFLPSVSFPSGKGSTFGITDAGGSHSSKKNLQNIVFPASMERSRKDLSDWKDAIESAEDAWLPYRVGMQTMYEITVLNEHLAACMERRKDLTLLREFEVQNANGEKDKKWTEYFQKTWFTHNVLNFILDAQAYGYNLISIGDIKDSIPVNPTIIQRRYISPDRHQVSPFEYNPSGIDFRDEPYSKWHIWVSTLPTNGISNCGYGLLYNVAKSEIYLRNNLAFNTSFIQMFAQPYRLLKTSKTEGPERDAAQAALEAMGDAGYIMLDLMDELEFLNDGAGGNGYKSYNDFEHRLEAKISKLWLGHADAIDSVPGKLGSTQTGNAGGKTNDNDSQSPVNIALRDKQSKDGGFVEPIVNDKIIPKLREIGIGIPDGYKFVFLNNAEKREIQQLEANKNIQYLTGISIAAQAGLEADPAEVTKVTGITFTRSVLPPANTDNNVTTTPTEQRKGKAPLKNPNMKREHSPKKVTK